MAGVTIKLIASYTGVKGQNFLHSTLRVTRGKINRLTGPGLGAITIGETIRSGELTALNHGDSGSL